MNLEELYKDDIFKVGIILVMVICLCMILLYSCEPARAEPVDLWKGLLTEAVSEGYNGMYGVACCVRNRLDKDMSIGLCGLKRKDIDKWINKNTLQKHRDMAKEIQRQIFVLNSRDVTNGATHYEAIERYGIPYWAKKMIKTVKIGEHTFYK